MREQSVMVSPSASSTRCSLSPAFRCTTSHSETKLRSALPRDQRSIWFSQLASGVPVPHAGVVLEI